MIGRGEISLIFVINGKLKKENGVIAVQAVVELIDLG
jgi:hypothetical protein